MTINERAASAIRPGTWIQIPDPAVPRGWFQVLLAEQVGGWTFFKLRGRRDVYSVSSSFLLRYSTTEPAALTR